MKFEKKLIILNGNSGAKGTVSLEKNSLGLFATLNAYHLPPLDDGEYILGVKNGYGLSIHKIGDSSRVLVRFELKEFLEHNLNSLHFVIFDTVSFETLLYGTLNNQKLWGGNLLDGLKQLVIQKNNIPQVSTGLPEYSKNNNDIKDYFYDITPNARIEIPENSLKNEAQELLEQAQKLCEYNDGALAQVNYFVDYTTRKDTDTKLFLNPVDEHFHNQNLLDSVEPDVKTMPWQYIKNYIEKTNIKIQSTAESVGASVPDRPNTDNQQHRPLDLNKEAAFTVPPPSHFNAESSANNIIPEFIFFEQIKDQVANLFKTSERYEKLEELMPDTKWIKINYDEKKYYVLGLIGSDTNPDYICYGVPALHTPAPPAELGDDCKWVPLDMTKPTDKGYWLMFQNAKTGKSEN